MKNLTLPLGRCLLRLMGRDSVVSFSTALVLRKLSIGRDSLGAGNTTTEPGSGIRHTVLRRFLANDALGEWSLCTETINYIEGQLKTQTPNVILEFGSGISTLCFARFMRDIHADMERAYVVSVEQNPDVVESVLRRLLELNLDRYVRFVRAPLLKQWVMDREIRCYAISDTDLKEIEKLRPDFIMVDGPAAEAGARFGTLPLVRNVVAPEARVLLDDAFRDGELDTAKAWIRLLNLKVEGVLPTRKGLLIGRLVSAPGGA